MLGTFFLFSRHDNDTFSFVNKKGRAHRISLKFAILEFKPSSLNNLSFGDAFFHIIQKSVIENYRI